MRKDDYWFPAKKYGWGWGLPVQWQGWVVYGLALILLACIFFLFPPATDIVPFLVSTWGVLLVLVAICFIKDEQPQWRWSK